MARINVGIRSVYIEPREPRAGDEVSLAVLIRYYERAGRDIWYGVEVDNIHKRYEKRYVRPLSSFTTGLGSFTMPDRTVTLVFRVGHYEDGEMVEDGRRTVTLSPRPPEERPPEERPPEERPPRPPRVVPPMEEAVSTLIAISMLEAVFLLGYVLFKRLGA